MLGRGHPGNSGQQTCLECRCPTRRPSPTLTSRRNARSRSLEGSRRVTSTTHASDTWRVPATWAASFPASSRATARLLPALPSGKVSAAVVPSSCSGMRSASGQPGRPGSWSGRSHRWTAAAGCRSSVDSCSSPSHAPAARIVVAPPTQGVCRQLAIPSVLQDASRSPERP